MSEGNTDVLASTQHRPDRAAHESIRGYVHQATLTALEWLRARQNDVLVCEGNEDIDRLIFDSDGNFREISERQIKAIGGSVTARTPAVHESIFNFLRSFHVHALNNRRSRFAFSTTAAKTKQRIAKVPKTALDTTDVLERWIARQSDSSNDAGLIAAIKALAERYLSKPKSQAEAESEEESEESAKSAKEGKAEEIHAAAVQDAIAYLDSEPARWTQFLDSVQWSFKEPTLTELQQELVATLASDTRSQDLPHELLSQRLVAKVLSVSSKDKVEERTLTRATLDVLLHESASELKSWSEKSHAPAFFSKLLEHESRIARLERDSSDEVKHAFVPLNSASELEISTQQDLPLLGRADSLTAAASFLNAPERVLIVIAPGGVGKSRFLRELHATAEANTRSPWLRRIGRGTIEAAVVRGLPREQPLLLCMDDAGLDQEEALELARLAKPLHDGVDAKVVLAGRIPDQFLLERLCREAKVPYQVLRLEPLAAEFADKLAIHEAPHIGADGSAALRRFSNGNLFVLRAAAQLVAAGVHPTDLTDQEYLRGILVDRLVREAAELLTPLGVGTADTTKLLLRTALDAPVHASRASEDVRLETLRAGKILRVVGNGLRFRADVEGDLLLGHLTREPWAQVYLRQELEAQPEQMPPRLRNLAAAGDGYPADVVRKACADWIASAATTTGFARRQIMKVLPHAVAVAPAEVGALCQQFLTIPPAEPTDPIEKAFRISDSTTDDYGPVILALARNGHPVAAMTLARMVYGIGTREGMYSNYKVQTIGAEIVNPVFAQAAGVHSVLGEIERWTAAGAPAAPVDLIKSVLDAMLAGTFRWSRSTGVEISWGEKSFADTPDVRSVREHAVRLLKLLVHHPERELRLAACKVANEIGRGGTMAALDDKLRAIVEREVAAVIPELASQLDSETDFAVMDEIERGLLTRWAAERIGAEAAAAVLKGRTWSPLYRAYQLVHHPGEWKRRHDDVFELAPATDRWKWWVERLSTPTDEADVRSLAETLRDTYTDAPATLDALRRIADGGSLFVLLDAWCAVAQPIFVQLQDRPDLPAELKEIITRTHRRLSYRNDPTRAVGDLEKILPGASDVDVGRFLDDSSPLPLPVRVQVARALVRDERVAMRVLGLKVAFYGTDLTPEQGIELLAEAIRDGDWLDHWSMVWTAAARAGVREKLSGSALRSRLLERLAEGVASLRGNWGGNTSWYISDTVTKLFNAPSERLELVEVALAGEAHIRDTGALLGPLASSDDQLPLLIGAILRWLSEGWLSGLRGVSDLVETAITKEHKLAPGTLALATSLVAAADDNKKLVGIVLLSELRDSPDACVEVVEACTGPDKRLAEIANRVVGNFCRTRGVYSAKIGEPPPALQGIVSTLASAYERCRTPAAKALLSRMRLQVERDLEQHAREDAELLDPRH